MTSLFFEIVIKKYLNFERFYSRNYDWSMYALLQPITLATNDMLMLGVVFFSNLFKLKIKSRKLILCCYKYTY